MPISDPLADQPQSGAWEMTDDRRHQGRTTGNVSLFGTGTAARGAGADALSGAAREALLALAPSPMFAPARVWKSLTSANLSDETLLQNGLFPLTSADPAVAAFDLLRTRLLQGLAQKGWRRIAVTSPTHDCGKSFVAANLALSLARRPEGRAVLVDMDLRAPALANLFGHKSAADLREYLVGEQPLETAFRRHGRQLAIGFNASAVPDAAELLQDPQLLQSLEVIAEQLDPDIILYDMPPALVCDDLLAISSQVDAVLLVADGTRTTPAEIRRCEELFGTALPIMGVVLNRSQDLGLGRYRYGKG